MASSSRSGSEKVMDFFENAAVVRLKGAHDRYLFANENRSVTQQRSTDGGAEWTVEHVSGGKAIRLKSIYNQYLNATDFAFLLGLTGKKVRQSYASKADSAVEWEPVPASRHQVKLRTKSGSYLRANGAFPPYRNSVTHDTPKSPTTQHWILWEVEVVKSLSDGPLPEENSPIRLPSSLKESPLASMSPKGGMRNSSLQEESPIASMSPKGGLRNKPLRDLNYEETDEEEQADVIPNHRQVPHPLASSGAHASLAHGRNNLTPDRPPVEPEQPESSLRSSSDEGESSVDESELPPRQAQVQNLSRPKHQELLAQRRRNASEDERVSAQRVRQAPRRQSDMAYYDSESGPRQVQSPRMRQEKIFNEEGEEEEEEEEEEEGEEPAGYQNRHDGREQRTPRITHAQGRRHQDSHDDREKLRRMAESPPRRNGTSSHEQDPRELMEPSTARRDERFTEEFNRKHGGGQFSPMSPRSTDRPRHTERVRRESVAQPPLRRNERELDERGEESSVESSPRAHLRPVDERGHRRRADVSDVEQRTRSRAHPRIDARRVEYDNSDEEQRARSRAHARNDARRVEYDNSDEEQRVRSRVHVGNDARRVEYDNSDEEQRARRIQPRNNARRVEYDNSDEEQRTPRTQPIRNEDRQQQQRRHRRDGSSALRREERHHHEYVEEPSPRRKSQAGSVDDGGESSTSTRSSQRAGVKRIFFSVLDDSGEAAAAGEDEWGSFLFEGTTLDELTEELHELSGINEDFYICVRIPVSGKLSILRLIPAVQGPLNVELVPVKSAAGRALARPHSVRTRYSRESIDY